MYDRVICDPSVCLLFSSRDPSSFCFHCVYMGAFLLLADSCRVRLSLDLTHPSKPPPQTHTHTHISDPDRFSLLFHHFFFFLSGHFSCPLSPQPLCPHSPLSSSFCILEAGAAGMSWSGRSRRQTASLFFPRLMYRRRVFVSVLMILMMIGAS